MVKRSRVQSSDAPRRRIWRVMVAGLFLPLPHLLHEGVAAQVVARLVLACQLPFHHHLGGDAGVVGARLPQGLAARMR
jgi:hypothetical protein